MSLRQVVEKCGGVAAASLPHVRRMDTSHAGIGRDGNTKDQAYSIRCLKDWFIWYLIYLERLLQGSRSFFIRLVAGHSFFMMTKQEKIALQQENPTNALAFKEGFFYPVGF